MYKTFLKSAFAMCALLSLASCAQEPYDDPTENNKNDYTKNFLTNFGLIDENHTWNMARPTHLQLLTDRRMSRSLSDLKLKVYTDRPGNQNSVLMATLPADKTTAQIDFPADLQRAFIALEDENGLMRQGDYVDIEMGSITADFRATPPKSVSDISRTEIGRQGWIQDKDLKLKSLFPEQNFWKQYNPDVLEMQNIYKLYTLTGQDGGVSSTWSNWDIYEIVGKNMPFQEQGTTDGKCNLKRWFTNELGQIQSDIEYVIGAGGSEVDINFFYANTQKHNALGYMYYQDGATKLEKVTAPRYIVLPDARMEDISVDGTTSLANSDLNELFGNVNVDEEYSKPTGDHMITGKKMHLIYYDEAGNPSYTFPAGTHIVFFLMIGEGKDGSLNPNVSDNNMRYSTNELNELLSARQSNYGNGNACAARVCDKIESNFVTFVWNGQLIFGAEDEVDDDMNDLLFYIEGDFAPVPQMLTFGEPLPNTPTSPDVQWIVAVEDLGGTADFDFNDIVFGVSYNAETRKIKVTPLAAGGTLSAQIMFNGEPVGPEVHEWFGVPTSKIWNTYSFDKAAEPIEIDWTGEGDFTMSGSDPNLGNMGGFSVRVNGAASHSITAPGKGEAPQMICMGPNWQWPKETKRIDNVYSDFGEWGKNYQNAAWTNNFNTFLVIKWK